MHFEIPNSTKQCLITSLGCCPPNRGEDHNPSLFKPMQSPIRFLKEIYFTGFAVIFNTSRAEKASYKAGYAIGFLCVFQWFALIGVYGYIEMHSNRRFILSALEAFIPVVILFFVNNYIL